MERVLRLQCWCGEKIITTALYAHTNVTLYLKVLLLSSMSSWLRPIMDHGPVLAKAPFQSNKVHFKIKSANHLVEEVPIIFLFIQ